MNTTIHSLYQKYGDFVFSLAVQCLLDYGRKRLCTLDLEQETARIFAAHTCEKTAPAPLITPELEANILRCASELAHIDVMDILKYIQTDMHFSGVTVHPGKIVVFKDRDLKKASYTLFVRSKLDAATKDQLASQIRNKLFPGYSSSADAIGRTLNEMDILWDCITCDDEIVF